MYSESPLCLISPTNPITLVATPVTPEYFLNMNALTLPLSPNERAARAIEAPLFQKNTEMMQRCGYNLSAQSKNRLTFPDSPPGNKKGKEDHRQVNLPSCQYRKCSYQEKVEPRTPGDWPKLFTSGGHEAKGLKPALRRRHTCSHTKICFTSLNFSSKY